VTAAHPRVFRSLSEVPRDFGPCATTIGNFDGVHLGHQALMKRVASLAAERGWKAAVLTFDPHPAKIVAPTRAPRLIMTTDQRAEVMGSLGIQEVLVLPFTRELSQLSPEEFVRNVLVDAMQVRAVLVGEDFRFGHKQAGDTDLLTKLGAQYGFEVDPINPVNVRGERVSSSLVRQMTLAGRINRVGRLLGRPFALEGDVVRGHGIGRTQTVPTLNLRPSTEVWPEDGVYVTRTTDPDSGRVWRSISNIGMRPTFDGHDLSIETYLLEPLGGDSPARIRVEFLWRVRGERKFATAADLKNQILRDVNVAQKYFRRITGKGRMTT
jgi:riboflavin kinase/FMN adenylyltransferase